MSITAALITAFASAIVAPILTAFFASLRERGAGIRVTAELHESYTPTLVSELLEGKGVRGLKEDELNVRWGIQRAAFRMKMTIQNVDKKRMDNVTVRVAQPCVCEVEGRPLEPLLTGAVVVVGDIQPRNTKVVHFWMGHRPSANRIQAAYSVSADEVGRVVYKYPMPEYLAIQWRDWVITKFTISCYLFFFVMIGYLLYDAYWTRATSQPPIIRPPTTGG